MRKNINFDQMKTVIMAQQDQEVESAKTWMRGPTPRTFNAQGTILWEACCLEYENPIIDVMSRFALIGFRHVMQQIEAEDAC